jgi:hypothetical protein
LEHEQCEVALTPLGEGVVQGTTAH